MSCSPVEPVPRSNRTAPALARAGSPDSSSRTTCSSAASRSRTSPVVEASSRSPNSSPPKRARNSPGPSASRSVVDTVRSSESPAAWPSESFTYLRSSRSTSATAPAEPCRRRASSSVNRRRLASPVSSSWSARWRSSSSARRRSVISVSTPSTRTAPASPWRPSAPSSRIQTVRPSRAIIRYSTESGSSVCAQRASSRATRSRSSGCIRLHQKSLLTSQSSAGKPSRPSICGETYSHLPAGPYSARYETTGRRSIRSR